MTRRDDTLDVSARKKAALLWVWSYHAMQARHWAEQQAIARDKYDRAGKAYRSWLVPAWVVERYWEASTSAHMHAEFARNVRDTILGWEVD